MPPKAPKTEFVKQYRVTLRALKRGNMRRGDSVTVRDGHPQLAAWKRDPAWAVVEIGRVQLDKASAARLNVPGTKPQAIVREIAGALDRVALQVRALHPDARAEVGTVLKARPALAQQFKA